MRPLTDEVRRDKQICVLLTPAVYEDINKVAYMKQQSVNFTIFSIVKEYLENHEDLVQQFNEVFNKHGFLYNKTSVKK